MRLLADSREIKQIDVNEVIKLHAVIRWGLYQSKLRNDPRLSLRSVVLELLREIDFSKISQEDIAKYIEPYDIFDHEEYHSLLNKKVELITSHSQLDLLTRQIWH